MFVSVDSSSDMYSFPNNSEPFKKKKNKKKPKTMFTTTATIFWYRSHMSKNEDKWKSTS